MTTIPEKYNSVMTKNYKNEKEKAKCMKKFYNELMDEGIGQTYFYAAKLWVDLYTTDEAFDIPRTSETLYRLIAAGKIYPQILKVDLGFPSMLARSFSKLSLEDQEFLINQRYAECRISETEFDKITIESWTKGSLEQIISDDGRLIPWKEQKIPELKEINSKKEKDSLTIQVELSLEDVAKLNLDKAKLKIESKPTYIMEILKERWENEGI